MPKIKTYVVVLRFFIELTSIPITFMSNQITWRSPSNIAIIKYWGKHGVQLPRNHRRGAHFHRNSLAPRLPDGVERFGRPVHPGAGQPWICSAGVCRQRRDGSGQGAGSRRQVLAGVADAWSVPE